ncbi:MAG TPA: DUF5723 family protein [Saprospiraceae bacterium]|nr:hypothetical protein [Saprospiraceae bacterium]MCB9271893.1 hypothetical protein [Lewinellaceae bacterium]HPG09423.1 DUF5723 family protein [Saprospiraceae bacterium]HPR00856.1 DUF5723 family protein [Saprospiraceae bacterium]HQU51535.1 DUF5723 family protein [Saprospiraceae bacterium]
MSKRTGIIAFLAFGLAQLLPAQNDWTVHFLTDLVQSGISNPAQVPQGWNVALPGGYMQLNSSPSLSHAVKQMGGKNQLLLSELGNHLDGDFKVQAQAQLEPFMVSYLRDKLSLAVQYQEVGNAILTANEASFRLLTQGNASLVGDTVSIGGSLKSEAYQKVGFSIGYHIPYFSIAVRLNVLQGAHYLASDRVEGRFYTDPDGYATYFKTDLSLLHAGNVLAYSPESNTYNLELKNAFIPRAGNNWGASVDIGTKLYLSRIFYIAASATNLGTIFWKQNAEQWRNRQEKNYAGVEVLPPFGSKPIDFPDVADSLQQWTSWQVDDRSFQSRLSPVIQLSMHYTIDEHFKFGLMYAREYEEQPKIPLFGAYFSAKLGNAIEIGTLYSTKNDHWLNLGLHSVFNLGPVQVFAITDNALDFLSPEPWHNFHFRGGINLRFDYDKS